MKFEADVDVITRINECYSRMSKGKKNIAGYICDHYEQAVFMTAAELGKIVGMSESTVVRFAMSLGYEGYPEFQKALASWVGDKFGSVEKVGRRFGKSSEGEILQAILTSDISNIQHTINNIDVAAFKTAVDIILKARTVYIVGLRSCEPLADFLHFYLNMIRGNNVLIRTTSVSEMFEQMIRIGDRDCIIGISFPRYSMRTLKCMEFANDRNAKVITITDSVHSPMNLYSSCNILAKSEMASIVDSLVAPLSVINALVVALCMRRPNEVQADLKMLEETWNNYQVYLNDEIDFASDDLGMHLVNTPLGRKDKE
ncbi:MurR/RpiR family transcriptional regulator [Butyrivibrio sp. VCB2001]|jgi:DNA-binding MurR/RpiR family transcriptional regulator|uniref:MurR/RpiR family transcriptional regulator n=1 Tax=Butyrivibrio sp. VCB2001 TaxID=1280667 RepID=UPI0003F6AFBC|nr:MurR/RpiR family transcriptional regulator [Butyrivibrio sp. VCB2001]MBP3826409.1 MurR/RpiR family transcriptional regulator [Butyrivibrio sp.]